MVFAELKKTGLNQINSKNSFESSTHRKWNELKFNRPLLWVINPPQERKKTLFKQPVNNRDDQPSFPFSLVGQTQSRCHIRVTSHIAKTNGEATRQQESKQKKKWKKINRVQPHKVGMSNWMSRRCVYVTVRNAEDRLSRRARHRRKEGFSTVDIFTVCFVFSRKAVQCVTDGGKFRVF